MDGKIHQSPQRRLQPARGSVSLKFIIIVRSPDTLLPSYRTAYVVTAPPCQQDYTRCEKVRPAPPSNFTSACAVINSRVLIKSRRNLTGIHLDTFTWHGTLVTVFGVAGPAIAAQCRMPLAGENFVNSCQREGAIMHSQQLVLNTPRPEAPCAQLRNPLFLLFLNLLGWRSARAPATSRQPVYSVLLIAPPP